MPMSALAGRMGPQAPPPQMGGGPPGMGGPPMGPQAGGPPMGPEMAQQPGGDIAGQVQQLLGQALTLTMQAGPEAFVRGPLGEIWKGAIFALDKRVKGGGAMGGQGGPPGMGGPPPMGGGPPMGPPGMMGG